MNDYWKEPGIKARAQELCEEAGCPWEGPTAMQAPWLQAAYIERETLKNKDALAEKIATRVVEKLRDSYERV